jgi:hypothetical protein
MATETSGNSNGFLYFIVGALVVAVVGFGIMYFNGGFGQPQTPVERAADAVANAADRVGDAANDAAN